MDKKGLIERLRQFDAYPKTLEDFRIKTFGGAIVTIVSALLMFVLFVSELNYYLTKEVHPELYVDTARGQMKLKINLNVTFMHLPCACKLEVAYMSMPYSQILVFLAIYVLSTDAMDVSGENQIDVDHDLFKQRLSLTGERIEDEPEKEELGDKSEEMVDAVQSKLDPNRCESCYGAETEENQCCNTCDDVREAYRKKGWAFKSADNIEQCKREGWGEKMKAQQNEGCLVYGFLEVNKVAGNFHFAPGKSFQQHHVHVHDLQALGGTKITPPSSDAETWLIISLGCGAGHITSAFYLHFWDPSSGNVLSVTILEQYNKKFNVSHTIHHMSFGEKYPGIVNPLDGVTQIADNTQMMFQYYVKIVPTTYTSVTGKVCSLHGHTNAMKSKNLLPLGVSWKRSSTFHMKWMITKIVHSNQFSVTKHSKIVSSIGDSGLPGVFVMYELSPMMVKYTEKQRSFMHFLTGVCAIIGGIFTVAGLIDSMIYHSARALQKKIELGKAT